MKMTTDAKHHTVSVNYISIAVAIGGLLFGFDTAVISGAITFVTTQFSLHSMAEGWLVSSGLLGCIFGVTITGLTSDRIGRKRTVILSGALFLVSAVGCAFAPTFAILVAARLIGGIGVGVASVISPMYISEFAPAEKRGGMVAYYQLAITAGILLAYFSNALLVHFSKHEFSNSMISWFFVEETWRPMFLVMAIPSLIFLAMLLRVPESPRWLVWIGKKDQATAILERVRTSKEAFQEIETLEEAKQKTDKRNFRLFDPRITLPLFTGITLAVLQQFSGINAIIYYGPRIFQSAGMEADNALVFQIVIGGVNLLFTFVAIKFADKYGRKFLLKTGLGGIVFSLFALGALFHWGGTEGIVLLVLMLLFIACFAFSLGPVTWIIINEIFPTDLRVKLVSICTMSLWVAVWLVGQFFPWLLDYAGAAATFWIFGFFSIINFIFSWKVVKETKGKTLEEMERVWH